jgi:hypothetical protein
MPRLPARQEPATADVSAGIRSMPGAAALNRSGVWFDESDGAGRSGFATAIDFGRYFFSGRTRLIVSCFTVNL